MSTLRPVPQSSSQRSAKPPTGAPASGAEPAPSAVASAAPTDPVATNPAVEPAEQELWAGGPTQLLGVAVYLLCALVAACGFFGAYRFGSLWYLLLVAAAGLRGIWMMLVIAGVRYVVTSERVTSSQGVLTRRTDQIELYRIKDTVLIEPFWLRMIGRGHVALVTSDATTPMLVLRAIRNPAMVREIIRRHVEVVRTRKGVREIDVDPDFPDDFAGLGEPKCV